MDLPCFALVTITFCALYLYFKKKLNFFEVRGIPYLPGLPLVGNMGAALLRRKHFGQVVDDIYNVDREARYVGAFDFGKPTVLLRDPQLIKLVTIKHFASFPDRLSFVDEVSDPLMGAALFNLAGEKWREARNLLTPAFTSYKMKSMFGLMSKCGKNLVDYLSRVDTDVVDTKDLFNRYTNDVIASCVFGIEVDSLNDPQNDFFILGKEATNMENMTVKMFLHKVAPWVIRVLGIKIVSERVANFFTGIVRSTVDTRDKMGTSRPDVIQLMMNARSPKLGIPEMTSQAFVFFFGGFDTTSTQMGLLAHELALNPDVQVKLQEEIDGLPENPTYEEINEMPYLDAVYQESLRRHTQSVIFDRLCVKEFQLPPALPGLEPFTVRPGMHVWVSANSIHKDPKYYDDPLRFDPDRYYGKKIGINDALNLGFGIGPRACIGNRFAILETKILFFHLLRSFTLKPTSRTEVPLRYSTRSFTLTAESGFWASIVPREK